MIKETYKTKSELSNIRQKSKYSQFEESEHIKPWTKSRPSTELKLEAFAVV